MDEQNVVYTFNGVSFIHKKEQNFDILYNMDGLRNMWREINKTQDKRCIYYLYVVPRLVKFAKTESSMVTTRDWGKEGGDGDDYLMGTEFLLGMMKKF